MDTEDMADPEGATLILLGYRDRNVHELVCHEVAERAGCYDRLGVKVKAVLGSDHPEAALSAGLGGSLVETLRGQRRWRAALVHTLHPMFWMWVREADPATATGPTALAGHPEGSIVWAFTQKVLADRGVADDELSVLRFPVGIAGDHQRLEALTSGAVDAAVLGSTFAPGALVRRGLAPWSYFGEALRFPTAGVAVDVDRTDVDERSVQAVVAAQRASMRRIKQGEPVALDAVASLLHESTREDALHLLRDYISPQYGPGHQEVQAVGAAARVWLTAQLGVGTESAADFFEGVR
jgi:hypothetical protein